METIEEQTLNYIRLALYKLEIKDIMSKTDTSRTTITNFIRNGIGTKETLNKLMALASQTSPNLPIPALV
jgi:hypothetical protein